jgi:hypothetical protein
MQAAVTVLFALALALPLSTTAYSIVNEGIVGRNNALDCQNIVQISPPICAASSDNALAVASFFRLNSSADEVVFGSPQTRYPNVSIHIVKTAAAQSVLCSQLPFASVASVYSTDPSAEVRIPIGAETPEIFSAVIASDVCTSCPELMRYAVEFSSPTSQLPFDPCATAWQRARIEASRELAAIMSADITVSGIGPAGIVFLYITTVVSALAICTAYLLTSILPTHVSNRLKLISIIFTMAYMYLLSGQGFKYFFLYNNSYVPMTSPESDMLEVSYAVPFARYVAACVFVPATFELVRLLIKGAAQKLPSLRSVAPFLASEIQIALATYVTSPIKWPMWVTHVGMLTYAVFDIRTDTARVHPRGYMWIFLLLLIARTMAWPLAEGTRIFPSSASVPIECVFDAFWVLSVVSMCIAYRNAIPRTPIPLSKPSEEDEDSDMDDPEQVVVDTTASSA